MNIDTFDYNDEPSRPANRLAVLWNLFTVLTLLAVMIVAGVFLMIFINPRSSLNPFPPASLPVSFEMPTATPTLRSLLPPTWTPLPTLEPTLTYTPRPTATLPPTPTSFSIYTLTPPAPTEPPQATPTRASKGYQFVVQKGNPLAIANIAHAEQGCNWMGVAGQVLDMSGAAKTQLIVVLGGTLDGKMVHPSGVLYSLSGVAPQYGQAGYEFVLADTPVASKGTLWVQLLNQSEQPVSDKVYFDTQVDCEKNLTLINFKQVR